MSNNTVYSSRFGSEVNRGTVHQLASSYEAKGYGAQRDGDYMLAERYFQHAEHWKRILNGKAK